MNVLISLNGETSINIPKLVVSKKIDCLIGVDGGIRHFEKQHIINIDLAIGDFDSYSLKKIKNIKEVVKLSEVKDETDFKAALNYVNNKLQKIDKIYVIGFNSLERPEHFYANLKLITNNIIFTDQNSLVFNLDPGKYNSLFFKQFKFNFKYISFFALENIDGLKIEGFKYNYNNELKIQDTICISNELMDITKMKVEFKRGRIICFLSK